jgi:hypothetical protein
MDPEGTAKMVGIRSGRELAYAPENWSEISETLHVTRNIVAAKALGLATWAMDKVATLNDALMPTIGWIASAPRNGSAWKVQSAGYERTELLADREAQFITKLASAKPVRVHRSVLAECLRKLPEMQSWIVLVRSVASAGNSSDSMYSVPHRIAARIHPRVERK